MIASIRTSRLILTPLTLPQLKLILTDIPALEAGLSLSISRDVLTDRVEGAIRKKIEKMTGLEEAQHLWQTYWLIIIRESNFGAGLAGFKGIPNENGSTEIGYGIDLAFQNKGYTTEAVRALVEWALQHPPCKSVTAKEVTNPASRRLLEKLGAQLISENDSTSSWEFTR